MSLPVLRPDASPFSPEQVELLNRLLPTLSGDQMVWLNGYLAALRSFAGGAPPSLAAPAAAAGTGGQEVTVLFGSQSGNCQRLGKALSQRLQQAGFSVTLSCMSEYKTSDLRKVKSLLVLVSTHGEGDPPDKAKTFYDFLHSKRAPKLAGARFAVLALGDLSYKHYCKTGKDFDARLEELGAARLHARADCDVDYQDTADAWMEAVLAALGPSGGVTSAPSVSALAAAAGQSEYSRNRPFSAEVLENINLNGRGSEKETRYLKLSLADSGLTFEPGDALGLWPENHPHLVNDLLAAMQWSPDELVPVGKEERPLGEALAKHYEVTLLTRPLLEGAAQFSRDGLKDLVTKGDDEISAYLVGRDLLDLVRDFALGGTPAKDFVRVLRRLPPRLYSISSSQKTNPDEVDLTVAAVRYHAHGRQRYGTCSVHCAERLQPGDKVPVFVHTNPNFRLPEHPDTPVIMIGPGTGVAPFRAFLEEREEAGHAGKNWLFFGDQRFRTDFLFQLEWQRWVKRGHLARMDVAFSRDTACKVYVQHRMAEASAELYDWLQNGAAVYVCGDEKRMAPDVHATLGKILEREGGMTPERSQEYLEDLVRQRRYQRDVY